GDKRARQPRVRQDEDLQAPQHGPSGRPRPRHAFANPLNIHLSGFPAKAVTRAYHLYAIPRFVNRWAVSLAYLTDLFFDRSVVSMGLASEEDARFYASEGIPMPKPD